MSGDDNDIEKTPSNGAGLPEAASSNPFLARVAGFFSEEEEEIVKKKRKQEEAGQEAGFIKDEKGDSADATEAGYKAGEQEQYELTIMGVLGNAFSGIRDKGDYFKVALSQLNGELNREQIKEQVKKIITQGVLNKGWDTFYFYNDKNQIDPVLTSLAREAAIELTQPGYRLAGRNVIIEDTPMRKLEPWRFDNPLTNKLNEAEAGFREKKQGLKDFFGRRKDQKQLHRQFRKVNKGPIDDKSDIDDEIGSGLAGGKPGGPTGP
jgi:hypothetical protein